MSRRFEVFYDEDVELWHVIDTHMRKIRYACDYEEEACACADELEMDWMGG